MCYDELNHVKKELFREGDEIKVKQKAGILHYKAFQGRSVTLFNRGFCNKLELNMYTVQD